MHFMFKNRANYISQQHTAKHNLCMVFILSISLEVLCTDSLNQSRVSCPNRICCEVQLFLLKSNLETMWNRGAHEKRNSRILSSNTISFEEHKDLSALSHKKLISVTFKDTVHILHLSQSALCLHDADLLVNAA